MAQFGELLSELRQDRRMSQRDLAMVMHVSVSTISNYENGVHYPDVDKLIDLGNIFNVTIDYLLGLSPVRERNELLSADVLPGKSAYQFLKEFLSLPPEKRSLLNALLEDESFCASIRKQL